MGIHETGQSVEFWQPSKSQLEFLEEIGVELGQLALDGDEVLTVDHGRFLKDLAERDYRLNVANETWFRLFEGAGAERSLVLPGITHRHGVEGQLAPSVHRVIHPLRGSYNPYTSELSTHSLANALKTGELRRLDDFDFAKLGATSCAVHVYVPGRVSGVARATLSNVAGYGKRQQALILRTLASGRWVNPRLPVRQRREG